MISACPLDCYDACEIAWDGNFRAQKSHLLYNGKLCKNFGNLISQKRIRNGANKDTLLKALADKLSQTKPEKTLYFGGSGNVGVMKDSLKMAFGKLGCVIADGSLCDGAGSAGIQADRKSVVNPPFEYLLNSELIVVWGRNLTVTSPHIYSKIQDKTFITIDPVSTEIAKKSVLHIQLKPKTDYLLALVLARFAFLENLEDKEFLENIGADYKSFFELARGIRIKQALAEIDVNLDLIGDFLHLIEGKKIAFLIGVGVQKYFEGDDILRCIDGLAALIGLFGKNYGGVWYLSDSKAGFKNPFLTDAKTVELPSVDFSKYDVVFVNGANPAVSMPNSQRVIDGLKKAFVVFFGTFHNETCKYADLIIGAKNFQEKRDIRLSYATDEIIKTEILIHNDEEIGEFELAKFLVPQINDEDFYLSCFEKKEPKFEIESFDFIDDVDVEVENLGENEFHLVTSKTKNGLNSQFFDSEFAYFPQSSGVEDGQIVTLKSKTGTANFIAKQSQDLRKDCVLIFAGTKNINFLTTSMSSKNGSSAIFQEQKVKLMSEDLQEEDIDLYDTF